MMRAKSFMVPPELNRGHQSHVVRDASGAEGQFSVAILALNTGILRKGLHRHGPASSA